MRACAGVFFFYEFSPIRVKIAERSRSFTHFLTSVCAIVGGVFTVMGMVDACVHTVLVRLKRRHVVKGGGIAD